MRQTNKINKARIALLRGWFLNPWEAMRYQPLASRFDITAFGLHRPLFDLSGLGLNFRQLHWPGELFYAFGNKNGQFINRVLYKHLRYNEWMLGAGKDLAGFDIYHSADTSHIFSLQAARAKKKYGGKLALTVWENIPFLDQKGVFVRSISQEVIAATDLFMPVTERSRDMLLIEGIPDEKIKVIAQPVDLEKFHLQQKEPRLLAKLGLREGQPLILFVGRLTRTKGIEFLLYAVKMLVDDLKLSGGPPPKLVMVGGGDRKFVDRIINKLNLRESVVMAGEVAHADLLDYYAAADIFVLPSIPHKEWQEQFGMVLIEAMACGKAVISTLSGSIPDVVSDAGLLVQPADAQALYGAIKKLVADPSLRDALGDKARSRVESEFSQKKIAEATAAAYEELLK